MNTEIDLSYFQEKIGLLNRDIDHYARSSADLARTLVRLAITANEGAARKELANKKPLSILLNFAEHYMLENRCDCDGGCRCGYIGLRTAVDQIRGRSDDF